MKVDVCCMGVVLNDGHFRRRGGVIVGVVLKERAVVPNSELEPAAPPTPLTAPLICQQSAAAWGRQLITGRARVEKNAK